MAKSKTYTKKFDEEAVEDKWEDEEVVVETSRTLSYNTISLVNKISAKVKLRGSVTKNWYEWSKAGAKVGVDERDVPDLLKKKLGEKPCCGGNLNWIFEKVE